MYVKLEKGNPRQYTDLGCSPIILSDLIRYLSTNKHEIQSLDIALYLFNNVHLCEALFDLADSGCKIRVFSIPLEGYDNDRPVEIFNQYNNKSLGTYTKYDYASLIYKRVLNNKNPNFEFRIVPHMYLRSSRVKPFSRGNMPYSLHCKTMLVTLTNGKSYVALTSSNLATRDAGKIELAFLTELTKDSSIIVAKDFFEGLTCNSISYKDFDENADYSHYKIEMRRLPEKSNICYTAPFYYNSAPLYEERIKSMISKARNRIVVCAQHISSMDYFIPAEYLDTEEKQNSIHKEGFLIEVLKKSNNGIPVTLISQTYEDASGNHNCRKPQNAKAFIQFAEAAKRSRNCHYYVNPNLHAKFILVDDSVLITTTNFTPTQFIYLPNVNIEHFERIPNASYSGIFCEVGAYFGIINPKLANEIEIICSDIIQDPNTSIMF